MNDITEIEKEIYEEVIKAKQELRLGRGELPSGIDREKLIAQIGKFSRYAKYFTTTEQAEELSKKENYVINNAKVQESYCVEINANGKMRAEILEDTADIDDSLDVIQFELTKNITTKVDEYLDSNPSLKLAQKLFITVDDLLFDKDIQMDIDTWITVLRYRFTVALNIHVI